MNLWQEARVTIGFWYARNITGRTRSVKFYVTALNTFDGGPPGIFGEEDSIRVTQVLLGKTAGFIRKKHWLGFMSRNLAFAKSFILMTRFWFDHALQEKEEKERHIEEKRKLISLLLEKKVPVPLGCVYEENFIRLAEQEDVKTLQDLMLFIERHGRFPGKQHPLSLYFHSARFSELGLWDFLSLHIAIR